jgi:cytoskeletal protein CcmA (bactofilin family)
VFKRRKPEDVPAAEAAPHDPRPQGAHPATAEPPRAQQGPLAALANSQPGDSGLGVPPFRPAPPKETAMSRTPLTPPQPPLAPGGAPRPTGARPGREGPGEPRTLVVGRGISVQGTVQDAERLVVEGTVESSMIHANELAVAQGGVFKGEVEVEEAEVAGTVDGTLTVRNSLVVRASGRVLGTARCRRLQVEDGGQITGRIEMLGEAPRSDLPRLAAAAETAS